MSMITKITFEVGDVKFEATEEEARRLYIELRRLFGEREHTGPVPIQYEPFPIWQEPHIFPNPVISQRIGEYLAT